ncbi:fanconi-associated nuclease 1-like [Cydia strobilella]|uniref:fanconi-associated nuclease 1-like n=1 Tax=Cydia strobilella TaxID=1100964 RepID=UPI003006CC21
MSQQLAITNFFKEKVHPSPNFGKNMYTIKRKKRNLSLAKVSTPTASPSKRKIEDDRSILSDDDDFCTPVKSKPLSLSQSSNDSEKTIIYTPSPKKSSQTPKKTPKSSPNLGSTSKSQTPSAKDRFFSPTKNRSVKKRTPLKSKRNLSSLLGNGDCLEKSVEEVCFEYACEGMDDKTIFLLQIINKYLNDSTLKPLLNSRAQQLLQSSQSVVKPGMKLVCRLFWRKDQWFRRKQIMEIVSEDKEPLDDPSLQAMILSLTQRAWLKESSNCMTFKELSLLFKAEELKFICKDLKLKGGTKQEAIDSLWTYSRRTSSICSYFTNGKASDNSERVLKIMREKAGSCYKLSEVAIKTLNQLYVLMYLGMDFSLIRDKKFELALIYDKIGREPYPVDQDMELDNASVVFETNDEFERYMTAHNVYEDFLAETCSDEKTALVKQVYQVYRAIDDEEMLRYKALPSWLRRFTPANLYIRILDSGIQDLKKTKTVESYELAIEILSGLIEQTAFRQHKKAGWYAEKALILHGLLGRCDEAAEVLIEGFKSNLTDEEKDIMRNRAIRIARQKSVKVSDHLKKGLLEHASKDAILEKNIDAEHIYKQPMENTSKGKARFETKTSEGRVFQSVEEYCITHCISTGEFTHGEHWEGRIVTTMFFLLFWDIIYSKPRGVRGVFLTHFQAFPMDLFSDSFYTNRQVLIDDRLRLIESSTEEEVLEMMENTWRDRPEGEISGINLAAGWEHVSAVAACLGPRALAALAARLARHYRHARSGFPDVTLWNVYTKQIKFVEVKSDSDHPSMKQIQWMNYLREHGIRTGLCYVGANTTRQRARAGKKSP